MEKLELFGSQLSQIRYLQNLSQGFETMFKEEPLLYQYFQNVRYFSEDSLEELTNAIKPTTERPHSFPHDESPSFSNSNSTTDYDSISVASNSEFHQDSSLESSSWDSRDRTGSFDYSLEDEEDFSHDRNTINLEEI